MFYRYLKLFALTLLLSTTTEATQIKTIFDVSYGIFGKIGKAKAVLKKQKQSYTIDIELKAKGLAKVLSSGRKERHISKGTIKQGLLISNLYKVIKSYGSTVIHKTYHIDHKRKHIVKQYQKWEDKKLIKDTKTTLNFYAKNDLLTLYFNLDRLIQDKDKPQTYIYKAVGAERQKGKVTVIIPKKNARNAYKEDLGKDAKWYATAIIHQKIFSSKEGHLKLAIAKDGITNKAVLKDVIFFGDIRAVRRK